MICAHLRDHGVHFLRDEDGDCRVEWELPDAKGQMVVWLLAEGSDATIYHLHSTAPSGCGPAQRTEALELCNAWNDQHRWPKACVVDDHEAGWRIVLEADIDLSVGVTRSLFDTFTEADHHRDDRVLVRADEGGGGGRGRHLRESGLGPGRGCRLRVARRTVQRERVGAHPGLGLAGRPIPTARGWDLYRRRSGGVSVRRPATRG
jgi:hypothetical protein